MNCFVIMPFAKEFDDVYAAIKTNVENVIGERSGKCIRLDEATPAGPITTRLLQEIQSATFCIADVTGNIPNVMWEVGFAMALNKPIILITQTISNLPFDIKDLQTLEYDRNHITHTLEESLKKAILDTISALDRGIYSTGSGKAQEEKDSLIGGLLSEVQELKKMVSAVVKTQETQSPADKDRIKDEIYNLEGSWTTSNGSHYYAKVINNELVVPYCYIGNDELIGIFYNWQKTEEYWFAKFTWVQANISGFAFFKHETIDTLVGKWWGDSIDPSPEVKPGSDYFQKHGTYIELTREPNIKTPEWALTAFKKIEQEGLLSYIIRQKTILDEILSA